MCQLELRSIITDQESVAQGKLIKAMQIRDLLGLGLHQLSSVMRARLRRAIQMSLDNYPEVLDLLCFLNPPWAFHIIYSMVSPLLSDRTKSKVMLLSGDYRPEMLKHVDAAVFQELAEQATKDPAQEGTLPPGQGEVTVGAGKVCQIPVNVKAGSVVRWKYTVLEESYLRFSVQAIVMGRDEIKTVVEKGKKDHDGEGECVAEGDGVIVVEFNNYKSWFSAVQVEYDVSVHDPELKEPEVEELE